YSRNNSASMNRKEDAMKVICDETHISFKLDQFESNHWATGRNRRFLDDIKLVIPPRDRDYDEKTNWWTIKIEHLEVFEQIKKRQYGAVEEQGNLFSVAA